MGAQPLDRSRQRELRAAETLDEVAAPADAERLERGERVIEGREAARDPLREHELAGEDAVALEQELGDRAPPGDGIGRGLEERRGQRPAALHRRPRVAARGAHERARSGGRARGRPPAGGRARGAARAAAPRRRWYLARPDEVPQRLLQHLDGGVDLRERSPKKHGAARRRSRMSSCSGSRRGLELRAAGGGGPIAAASSRK